MGKRGAARTPGARMPESLCAGWLVDCARLLRRSSRLPPQLEAGKPHSSLSSQPSSSLLLPGPSSPAAPRRTRLQPLPEPAGQFGGRQDPSGSGQSSRGSSRCLPSPKSPVLASVILLPAEARTSLCSHVSLTTLLSTTSSRPLPSPSPGLQPLLSLGFPSKRCRPSLCLGAPSASRLLGPSPPHWHALCLSAPSRSVGGTGSGCSLPARPSLRGVASRGLASTLLMSTLARRPLGN